MAKLHLYTVFHGNLNFSYVSERFYKDIIERCYLPLLDVIERVRVPLGLELSGRTLELCQEICPEFIERLSRFWREGRCEVIGSGYVQSIFPLIPARVNQENLRRGNQIYKNLLGKTPKTAFINEQVYSNSITQLYAQAGYETLIVNWESARAHLPSDAQYRPCRAQAGAERTINIVWNSTQGYRNFQNLMEDKMDERSFWEALSSHCSPEEERLWPLYGSDWEVFDFTPWELPALEPAPPALRQMARIERLLGKVKDSAEFEFILPGQTSERFGPGPLVEVASEQYPLPFKKQDFFSVARWAVAGRSATRFNGFCHRLYQELLDLEQKGAVHDDELDGLWQRLCLLWSSDFRTFTTEEKYWQFYRLMGEALERAGRLRKPRVLTALGKPNKSAVLVGLGDGSKFESPEKEQISIKTNPASSLSGIFHDGVFETPQVRVSVNREAAGALHWVEFPRFSSHPILLSRPDLPLAQGAIGSVLLRDQRGMCYEDAGRVDVSPWRDPQNPRDGVSLVCQSDHELGQIRKIYHLSSTRPQFDIKYVFQLKDFVPSVFRLGRLIFNPAVFDAESLYFETVNGGLGSERFYLKDRAVLHDMALSSNVTSRGCLGASEGWVEIGDSRLKIRASTNMSNLAAVPMIHFEPGAGSPFELSLVFSLGEQDDTSFALWRGYFEWNLSVTVEPTL